MIENLLTILELEASADLLGPQGFSSNQADTKAFFLKNVGFFPAASLTFLHFQDCVGLICASLSIFSYSISELDFPYEAELAQIAWKRIFGVFSTVLT